MAFAVDFLDADRPAVFGQRAADPLAAVGEAYNAVFVEAESAGRLMFYGAGAGGTPTASAVRQATRAPELRPPVTTGRPGTRPRSCWTTAVQAASSCAAGAGARRPASR